MIFLDTPFAIISFIGIFVFSFVLMTFVASSTKLMGIGTMLLVALINLGLWIVTVFIVIGILS